MHTCVLCSATQYSLTSAFLPQAARQRAKADGWLPLRVSRPPPLYQYDGRAKYLDPTVLT